jgi:ubiquinone/menaquinone biosynthesis C-methylase UbiE
VGFYSDHILPHVIDIALRNPAATRLRAQWIPKATGEVLEVGIGTGLNLPFYTDGVRRVYGLDPSPELQQMARRRAADLTLKVEFIPQSAESPIPLPNGSIDTVVLTWTLCSVDDPRPVLDRIRRVMKTDGRLIVIEHGSAPDVQVRGWQDRLTPLWKRIARRVQAGPPGQEYPRAVRLSLPRMRGRISSWTSADDVYLSRDARLA